jgi:hypothetical protein
MYYPHIQGQRVNQASSQLEELANCMAYTFKGADLADYIA